MTCLVKVLPQRPELKPYSCSLTDSAINNIMPGLPPINLGKLKSLLRDPKMPSHKIMTEVANNIDSNGRSDGESEAEDHPVPNIFDMIIEASMKVEDESDEEEEESCHVLHNRRIPCLICGKEFTGSWPLNMHMAVAHKSAVNEQDKPGKLRLGKRPRHSRDVDSKEKKIRVTARMTDAEKTPVSRTSQSNETTKPSRDVHPSESPVQSRTSQSPKQDNEVRSSDKSLSTSSVTKPAQKH